MSRVKAVRVSCSGEAHKRDKIKELCAYDIPDTHAVFLDGELSQFSTLLGIPLLVIKLRPSMLQLPERRRTDPDSPEMTKPHHMYGYQEAGRYFPNHVAGAFMAGNVDGQHWNANVGSVLFARADMKPLETSHLHVMLGLLNEATYTASTTSLAQAMAMLTSASFKEYYASSVEFFKGQNEGEDWSDRSPWDDEKIDQTEGKTEDEDEEEDEVL